MSHSGWILTPPFMLFAYLCGSLSSAILVCHALGLPDPRQQGSKNPGTTNVLRIGGKKAAILTLAGDILKGWLPVMLIKLWQPSPLLVSLTVFAAFFGHLYPVFFQFKGGKGVATAFGGLTALSWPLGAALAATWLSIAVCFRYSSLAALVTALLAPLYTFYFADWQAAAVILAMSALLIVRHKNNIDQLCKGTEKKIGKQR